MNDIRIDKIVEEAKKVGALNILAKMTARFSGLSDTPSEMVLPYREFLKLVEEAQR